MPPAPASQRPGRRRELATVLAVVLAVVLCLLLASCSDDEGGKRRELREPVARSPLTGLVLGDRPPAHPVVGVKIDNSASSAPQTGLGSADLVTEELVEGGITRLAVFYYTEVPATVGPVRSMRATDIGIVRPLDAVLVASGGAAPTVSRLAAADITTFVEGATGFFRDGSRSAPYNLFMHLRELVRTLDRAAAPPTYLPFGDKGTTLPQGRPASAVTAVFSPSSSSTFVHRDGHYVNTDSYAAEGDEFAPETVLVLRVRVGDAGYRDPAGNPVPETDFQGQGEAMIFHGGRLVRGTWTKTSLAAGVRLRSAGKRVELPPGKVWIELVPADGGSVRVSP